MHNNRAGGVEGEGERGKDGWEFVCWMAWIEEEEQDRWGCGIFQLPRGRRFMPDPFANVRYLPENSCALLFSPFLFRFEGFLFPLGERLRNEEETIL